MASSSVSGVGPGSALKAGYKGADWDFLGVDHLIGTAIVLSGSVTLSSGTATVAFPTTLPGVSTDYSVMCQGGANYAYPTSITTTGFTANGTAAQVVTYVVVRLTNATVTAAFLS
jgi:hypothetical protein